VVSVQVFVEGGGDQHYTLAACREGFASFFKKVCPERHRPRIIACGSRGVAFDKFKTALRDAKADFVILLVDSEGPVDPGHSPWRHLKERTGDGWEQPEGAADDQAHLMVQCMESWFLADREALAAHYGQGFRPNALPSNPDIETIAKADVLRRLEDATRQTKTKGKYDKTRHGFALMALIDPKKVREASPHADRLCVILRERLQG
jgi:hypothetical protein